MLQVNPIYGTLPDVKPKPPFGQGQRAATILADQGDNMTLITDDPYLVRSRHLPPLSRAKGTRHMHRTTLTLPTSDTTDYHTTYGVHVASGRSLYADEVARPGVSQHITQFDFQHAGAGTGLPWKTSYTNNFPDKGSELPSKLHEPSLVNESKMMRGKGMHELLQIPGNPASYWSQYNGIHNKLGQMLGHGVPREYPVRRQYDVLTGEDTGAAWQPDNKRISGNRVLYNAAGRREASRRLILG